MSFIALVLMFMGKKINLSDRMIIREALNQNTMGGLVKLIKGIFVFTICFQTIGAILLSVRFIPQYGVRLGIYYSIFHSISAFCNAGVDILGNNSFINYSHDYYINIVLMILIIIGGLGFTVWNDIFRAINLAIKRKFSQIRIWRELSIHTKLVLITTIILLILGAILTFGFEKNNVNLGKDDTIGQRILKSCFYSTTLRTAGFTTINTKVLTTATKFISIIFMFIGGSPASTAGGIKNITVAIILLMVASFVKGNNETVVFKRKIPFRIIKRAVAIFSISICIVLVAIILLILTENLYMEQRYNMIAENINFIDIVYEVFSSFGTVGLTLDTTKKLSVLGRIIIMILMFIGRLGPITISIALFNKNNKNKHINYPECDILVG